MHSAFPGFPPEGIQFFRSLARHNNRDWFQPRKHVFEEYVKRPMEDLVQALNTALRKFAPEYVTEPGKAIYRIYRDTRFSKDKTPYKDHLAVSFSRRGLSRDGAAGYYFSVSHREIELGGGVYRPDPGTLLAVRRHVALNHEHFRKITGRREVKRLLGDLQGDQLSRLPKGFLGDDPAADLVRFKSYILFTTLPAELATTPRLFTEIVTRFQTMAPFIDFLNAPLLQPKAAAKRSKTGHFTDRDLPVAF